MDYVTNVDIVIIASPRGSRGGGIDMAPPASMDPGGRRGSLRLQSRMLGNGGGPNSAGAPSGLPQMNGGNPATMDLSRPPQVTSARSSGLI